MADPLGDVREKLRQLEMDGWRLRAFRDEIAVAVVSHRKWQDECAYAHEHAEMNVEWTWCPFCAARLPALRITHDESSYPPRGPVR